MGKADSWGDERTLELQVRFNLGPTVILFLFFG